MIWAYTLLVIIGSLIFVIFPLYWNRLQNYELPSVTNQDFSEADAWLSALSDLEDEYLLGRINKADYQQQKIFLQRSYLKWQKNTGVIV